MRPFLDKLVNITRHHSEDIAGQWCKAVKTNPRTSSYHGIPDDELISEAVDFYKNIRRIYFSEKPYREVRDFFSNYAEKSFGQGVPLHECVYALIMMRRHLWLYAAFQQPFLKGLDDEQQIGTITSTIRIFDHGIYLIIQKYGMLMVGETP
ncbi:MAG: hypothetical protein JXO48_02265 [Deltaproteobacteria bacterium]|nr:hypothetical protein [Deltaproteobacteria bacterium]